MEKDTSPPNWGATEGWEAWQSVNVHYYDVSSLDDKGSMVENNARKYLFLIFTLTSVSFLVYYSKKNKKFD